MTTPRDIIANRLHTEIVGHTGDHNGGKLSRDTAYALADMALEALAADHAVVDLPYPDDEQPGIFARWFLPGSDSTVGCNPPGATRSSETVWLTPFARCTPDHARAVAAALLAAADRAEDA